MYSGLPEKGTGICCRDCGLCKFDVLERSVSLLLPLATSWVTHAGTMALTTVIGFYLEGLLSQSHTVCKGVVKECVSLSAMCSFPLLLLSLIYTQKNNQYSILYTKCPFSRQFVAICVRV